MSLLSIVIPVYRVEDTLDACVRSVLTQGFRNFRLILVDDGSPDSCPEICDRWADIDRRVKVIHKENGGLSDARNAGIDAADGDYLMFVDSDDELAPGTLDAVMRVVVNHPDYDLVEFPVERISRNQSHSMMPISVTHLHSMEKWMPSGKVTTEDGHVVFDDMRDYWFGTRAYTHCFACNKVYRRRLFDNVHFPVGRVFEDVYTIPRLLEYVHRLAIIDEGCYIYRWNNNGITATATAENFHLLLDAYMDVLLGRYRWLGRSPLQMPRRCECRDFYLMVLNVQIYVFEKSRMRPVLPNRKLPLDGLSGAVRFKAWMVNHWGVDFLCRINWVFRFFVPRHR